MKVLHDYTLWAIPLGMLLLCLFSSGSQLLGQEQIELLAPADGDEFRIEHTDHIHFAWTPLEVEGEVEYTLVISAFEEGQDYTSCILHGERIFERRQFHETEMVLYLEELSLNPTQLYIWTVLANCEGEGGDEGGESHYVMASAHGISLNRLIIRDPTGQIITYDEPTEPQEPFPNSNCNNGAFEFNSFTNWTGMYGNYNNINQTGIVSGRHTRIAVPGFDVHVPSIPIIPPGGGTEAVRLGNDNTGAESESLDYSFTVNQANKDFIFRYAVILEDPGHIESNQPYFEINLYYLNGAGNRVNVYQLYEIADPNNPYFKNSNSADDGSPIVYREWTCKRIDLSPHLGEIMYIEFITADCNAGGHFGYAYIDGVCLYDDQIEATAEASMSDYLYCHTDPIILDASVSANVTDYTVHIQELPAGPTYTQVYFGQPGNIDLTQQMINLGTDWNCLRNYQVTLETTNDCSPVATTVNYFFVYCPFVDDAPDVTFCAVNGPATIGPSIVDASYTYQWSPATSLSDPNIANPLVTNTTPSQTTYTLTVTDPTLNCTTTDQVVVTIFNPGTLTTSQMVDACGDGTVSIQHTPSPFAPTPTITWSSGETGVSSITTSGITTTTSYTVNVDYFDPYHQTTCGLSATENVFTHPFFHQPLAALTIPTGFKPDGDGNNEIWYIGSTNNQWNQGDPYYGATEYQLKIFTRWGGPLVYDTGLVTTTTGFPQFAIEWDGTNNNGTPVPEGVYVYQVTIDNCLNNPHTRTGTVSLTR
ncbi:MAG: gliding motility-associated C-terminal domain-containing protein [Bacteroidota bacterium]